MQSHFTYKRMQSSSKLSEYAGHRAGKLEKYEIKPIEDIHFVFHKPVKGECCVELTVAAAEFSGRAKASGDNFYDAVDKVINRMGRQMARTKSKITHHKSPLRSAQGKFNQLNRAMEYRPYTARRTG